MPRKLYLSLQAAGQHGLWGCASASSQRCHQVKHAAITQAALHMLCAHMSAQQTAAAALGLKHCYNL